MENLELLKIAYKAKENAYAPYSSFKVGAAILTSKDNVYTGCNIENASYGATICAERTAIFKAISEGEKEFIKIAIVSTNNDLTFPCGICRQVLYEFMPKGEIILMNDKKEIKTFSLDTLLPHTFNFNN